MKPWKTALGIGLACAACCAVPLAGGAAALTSGLAMLGVTGAALLMCVQELLPLAFALLAFGVLVTRYLQRRKLATQKTCDCMTGTCSQ